MDAPIFSEELENLRPKNSGIVDEPRCCVIVTDIYDNVFARGVHPSIGIQKTALLQVFPGDQRLGIALAQREMLPERCVGLCSETNCVGVLEGVVMADKLGKLPFGIYILVLPPYVIGVLESPCGKPSDMAHLFSLAQAVCDVQQLLQRAEVCAQWLRGIIGGRFVAPG